jgi:hypothetical protein
MNAPDARFPVRAYARTAGILYLVIIAAGLFAQAFVRDRLVVANDAAATAANLLAQASLFRLGIAADLSTFVLAVPLTLILYLLLKPVDRDAALLMVFFNLVQDAVGGVNALNSYRPLLLLGHPAPLGVFSTEQLQALALLALKEHAVGFAVALVFFAFSCLALGYLVFRSGFLPRTLGVLMAIAGGCYLVNSFALVLSPRLAAVLFPAILVPAFLGELALALWLAVKGVDPRRREEAAGRTDGER